MTDETLKHNMNQKEILRFKEIDNYNLPTDLKQTQSMQSISSSVISDSGVFSYVRQPQLADDRNSDLPVSLRVSIFCYFINQRLLCVYFLILYEILLS